ncbi:MAG TPA: hypothetical protein VGF48_25670 [Thermoanaerobaculia bacterium]|jgi:uncharacterized protein YbjT (DUF2867 family)
MRSVLLLGATGLVGREVLMLLLPDDSVKRVVVVARRTTGLSHPRLHEYVFPLGEMEQHAEAFEVDQIICALGTTIKQAGSQERFRVVDHDLPLRAARLGLARGARHYLLVSSAGADARSRIFYSRVKGELERDLLSLGYRSVTIARPSILAGVRGEQRRGEQLALRLGWLMPASLKPIDARAVARALINAAREDQPGTSILDSRGMRERYS